MPTTWADDDEPVADGVPDLNLIADPVSIAGFRVPSPSSLRPTSWRASIRKRYIAPETGFRTNRWE